MSGVTPTPVGEVTVDLHTLVRVPVRDRTWERTKETVGGPCAVPGLSVRGVKEEQDSSLIIVGDFNQRIGQGGFVPPNLRSALQSRWEYVTIATSALGYRGSRCIDAPERGPGG